MTRRVRNRRYEGGFTLIELLIGGTIMLVVVLAALLIYSQGNKISADQQQYLEMQNDVRSAIYFISRDVRMAGTGIPATFAGYALEGVDNEATDGVETPDRLSIMGNIEDPLVLPITSYQGSAATVTVADYSLENAGYPDSYYTNRTVLVFPNPSSSCVGIAVRNISQVRHSEPGTNEGFNFSPGQAPGVNPPGGLSDICADSEFVGGSILFADVNVYWLDVTGNAAGLTAGVDGYIGGGNGGILYMTKNGVHYALAPNIETIQFQYNGDFDGDTAGLMDGFANWNSSWTKEQVGRIRQVRIMILGRTRTPFVTVGKVAVSGLHLYRRPAVANTAAATADDWRKRFLVESTSNIRNLSLNLYNTGRR